MLKLLLTSALALTLAPHSTATAAALSLPRPLPPPTKTHRQSPLAHDTRREDRLPRHQHRRAAPRRPQLRQLRGHSWSRAAWRPRPRRHHHHAVPAAARPRRNLGPRARSEAAAVEGYEARYITQTPNTTAASSCSGPQADLARDPRWGRSEESTAKTPSSSAPWPPPSSTACKDDDPDYWQAASLLKHFLANANEDHR